MGLCSIIILTYNALEYTKACYESILQYTKPAYEIIFVDNASSDGTLAYLDGLPGRLKVVKNHHNKGFSKGCNKGAAKAEGDTLLFLNNDTVVTTNWLDNLLACLNSDPKIGVVVPCSNNAAGASQLVTTYQSLAEMQQFAVTYNQSNPNIWVDSNSASAFCLLIRTSLFRQLGGFDQQFEIGSYEDIDLTFRVYKAGYRVVFARDTFIHHHGNKTFQANNISIGKYMEENAKKFHQKHSPH